MLRFSVSAIVAAALLTVTTPAPLGANTYDKLAYLTFSGPVQVPGVTLSAGTYRFRLTNPDTRRNVLQVLSHDGGIVYAMFHTIPDSRTALTEEPTVTFRETPAGVPHAIRSLFYGGEYSGYEFVYSKGGPVMFADEPRQPEIRYFPTPAAPVVEPIAEAEEPFFGAPIFEEPVAAFEPEPVAQAEPVELPRTATPLPLVALGGFTSLAAGLGLRRLRRRAQ